MTEIPVPTADLADSYGSELRAAVTFGRDQYRVLFEEVRAAYNL